VEEAMRDIRSDLQERATLIEEQVGAAHAHFQKIVQQLQNERDARVAELKSEFAALGKVMEAELRRTVNLPLVVTSPAPPQLSLADFFVLKLNEIGPMSKDELRNLAVKEGYFPDAEAADRGVHAALIDFVRGDRLRQLPDGAFAPPTLSQTIKLRRVM
jgi:hypothetical protein